MGIDIYMHWRGQTEAEKQVQYTGMSVVHGHVGYLREAYHGGPYATKVLLPESFDNANWPKYSEDGNKWQDPQTGEWHDDGEWPGVPIDAELLEKRLAETLVVVIEREKKVYGFDENKANENEAGAVARVQKSYRDFVALARQKQDELGELVRIYASG